MNSYIVMIGNERGLHARAAAKLVKVADQFEAEIMIYKDDLVARATSIMGLMMLAAGKGCVLKLTGEGVEREAAIHAIMALIERKFDEE